MRWLIIIYWTLVANASSGAEISLIAAASLRHASSQIPAHHQIKNPQGSIERLAWGTAQLGYFEIGKWQRKGDWLHFKGLPPTMRHPVEVWRSQKGRWSKIASLQFESPFSLLQSAVPLAVSGNLPFPLIVTPLGLPHYSDDFEIPEAPNNVPIIAIVNQLGEVIWASPYAAGSQPLTNPQIALKPNRHGFTVFQPGFSGAVHFEVGGEWSRQDTLPQFVAYAPHPEKDLILVQENVFRRNPLRFWQAPQPAKRTAWMRRNSRGRYEKFGTFDPDKLLRDVVYWQSRFWFIDTDGALWQQSEDHPTARPKLVPHKPSHHRIYAIAANKSRFYQIVQSGDQWLLASYQGQPLGRQQSVSLGHSCRDVSLSVNEVAVSVVCHQYLAGQMADGLVEEVVQFLDVNDLTLHGTMKVGHQYHRSLSNIYALTKTSGGTWLGAELPPH